MKLNKRFRLTLLIFIVSSSVLFYILVLSKTPFFLTSQLKTGDTLFRFYKPRANYLNKIVVVGVDDESMYRLNHSWPWGREIFAAFLERIRPLHPKVIGFDFSFVGKSQNEEADQWFADEIVESKNVILASFFDRDSVSSPYAYISPSDMFLKGTKATGFINVPHDQDGTVRRSRVLLELSDNQGFVYSFPVQLACAYWGIPPEKSVFMRGSDVVFRLPLDPRLSAFEEISILLDRKYHIPISFRCNKTSIRYIPFWKIIAGQVEKKDIEGNIILVGAVSPIIHDIHQTPIGLMPGIFINAYQTLMILEHDFVKKLWPYHHWIFLLIFAILFSLLFYHLDYLTAVITFFTAEFAIYQFAISLFQTHRLIFSAFSTMLVLTLVFLIVLFYKGLWTFVENITLQRQVVTDALTGLYSPRHLPLRLKAEFDRYRQLDKEFCFAMIDVDWFKRVNDTYGHEQGNAVLIQIADYLRNGVRIGDVVARYGGEEFCVILFGCTTKVARQILDRISRAIEFTIFTTPKGNFHVTISVGICSNKERKVKGTDDLIRFADEALYDAKSAGRNRICIYGTSK
ncbi:MAG TPA: diguanylate cyclase [Candidatus Omnitrophota bacterium]|nr:diguanylate cyclase [Candidatus Omnitrophota bacterium]